MPTPSDDYTEISNSENRLPRGVPKNVEPSPVPDGATFQYLFKWRWSWYFFNTNVHGKPAGVTVVPVHGGEPAFFPGPFDAEGRRDANVFTRHAEGFWKGWSAEPKTWYNGIHDNKAPFTPELIPYKPRRDHR